VATTGYFDLVGSDSAFVGDKKDFYSAASLWLSSDLPRVKQHTAVFLEGKAIGYGNVFPLSQAANLIPMESFPLEPSRGEVTAEIIGSNTYAAQVNVTRSSYILFKATYHPNWHASVDGVEAHIIMLMPSYMGVKIEPGIHQVLFEYRPEPWRLYLVFAGLLTLLVIAFVEWPRERFKGWVGRLPFDNFQSRIKHVITKITSWKSLHSLGERLNVHLPFLGVLLVFTLLAGLPLFQFKIMSGHDSLEYLPRVVEFFADLKAGQLFPRWAADLSAGYGQPLFLFNPPLFYYLSSLFHALGVNFIGSENLACFALLCLVGLGMYLFASNYFGSLGGLVAAVAYLFAPYLLVNLYVRHSLADFIALAFLPWAFWGVERFIQGSKFLSYCVGPFSIGLLLLCSNPVSLIAIPALVLYIIFLAYTNHSQKRFLRGILCLALGLGLSAFFWLPALVERRFTHLERLLEGYLNYTNHFVYPWQLINSPWGYGISVPGPQDGMSFAIGPMYLLLSIVAILIIWRFRLLELRYRMLVIFSLVLLLLACFFATTPSQFIWDRLPLLQYLEFPWRLLTLVAFSTALLFGLPLFMLHDKPKLAGFLAVLLIGGIFISGIIHAKPNSYLDIKETDYIPQSISSKGISVTTAEEYEPIWVQQRPSVPMKELVTLLDGEARWTSNKLSPTHYTLQVNAANQTRLGISIFYFPGWNLSIDGTEQAIDYQNPQGLITFTIEPGEHQVTLIFANTPIRNLSSAISLLAIVLLLLTVWLNRKSAQ
jgi:hypothetical protein